MTASALSHLKVLDLSRVLAGPWAAQLLADFGAEVIKVERPGTGDDTRHWGPPFAATSDGKRGDAAYYFCANRNKKSVTIDITKRRGQDLIRALAERCDVLIENYKVGGLARYGLDYASMHKAASRLIYCSVTGFGQTGPYATRAGYDFLIQAMGGLMSITGRADSEEGGGPLKVGVAVTDLLTGLYAASAILAALAYRDRTGHGQYIDLALLDVQVACLANQATNYLFSGVAPRRLGNAHPNIVPYQDFPTADGSVIVAVGNDGQFERFCAVIGHPEIAADERFVTNVARVEHRGELIPILRRETKRRPTGEWVRVLRDAGVPCGPVNDLAQVFDDEQVRARGMKIALEEPGGRIATLVGNPIKFSETAIHYRSAPPSLGQHTEEVLASMLGYDTATITRLRTEGVV